MTLRQLLSEKAVEVLKPIDQLHGRRLGDTELIDSIRTLLHSSDYVFNTSAHADAVLDRVNYIKSLLAERQGSINLACTPEGNTALHIACKTVPSRPTSMTDSVWLTEANFKRIFRVRNDIVRMLVEAGANPYLANFSGATCIDIAPEGPPRESLIAYLLELRLQAEPAVQSVPPLDASRLMKRSKGDSGYATFSHIAKHCVYYLYKGGIYLWDVRRDIEHVVYQPREADPMITALEQRFAGFERRKSLAVTGQNVGKGMWTSKAITTEATFNSRASFDAEEGDDILRRLALLEAKVALVGNFIITTGVDVKAEQIPREGVIEWVVCNTGAVVGVKLNSDGVCLRQGRSNASPRRQSQVCGSAADYPEGMTLDTNIFQNCAIRFSRRNNASHVCCAFDGLRRRVAYVVAVKRSPNSILGKADDNTTFCGFANDWGANNSTEFGAAGIGGDSTSASNTHRSSLATTVDKGGASAPLISDSKPERAGGVTFNPILDNRSTSAGPAGTSTKRVSFGGSAVPFAAFADNKNNSIDTQSTASSDYSSSSHHHQQQQHYAADSNATPSSSGNLVGPSKVFAPEEDGAIFRVCSLSHRGHPKESLEDVVDDLCNAHVDPFTNGTINYVDFKIPAHYGDAVCVTQCGDDVFILYCVRGVVVADATECVGKPVATFTDITSKIHLPEDAFIQYGISTEPQRFRPIKVANPTRMFLVQTDEVELLSLSRSHEGVVTVEPMMRIPKDRIAPHSYTPFFHGSRDELVLIYQSPKKTLVCSYDFNRRTFQSLCKLPKPSSLRFFPANKEEGQELPQSVFAVAFNSPYFLRYNITMHVMSVYSWDEVIQKQESKKLVFVPSLFLRDPKAMVKKGKLTEMITKYASPTQIFTSMPCAWLIVECSLLQKLVKDSNLLARDKIPGFNFGSTDAALSDSINATIHNMFAKIAPGTGGKVIAFQPPPFVYMPSEDEELDGDEVALMEEDYFAKRPRHEGVWCAYFADIGDAMRASIQLHRALSKDAKWDEDVLRLKGAEVVKRPYQIKSEVERKHASVLADRDETPFDERGPRIRTLVVEATTTTPITQLLKAHRMSTDTKGQFPIPGEPKYPPIEHDGVTVVPTKSMGVLTPILPIVTVTTPQTRKLAPVEPIEGSGQDAGRGSVFAPIENNLTLIVPFELRQRLYEF